MKKITFILLLLCSMLSFPVVANQRMDKQQKKELVEQRRLKKENVLKKQHPAALKKDRVKKPLRKPARITKSTREENVLVLDEDFSRFTAGSEAAPDAVDITDFDTYEIPASYTKMSGWVGSGIFQAGGSAYIGMVDWESETSPGFIATPYMDLSANAGNYVVTFKARSKSESDVLSVYWNDATEEYDGEDINITNTWQEYTLNFSNGDNFTYVDFYPYEAECYIDDIQISQPGGSAGTLSAPAALAATDVTEDGFTANWNAVSGAAHYLLSVYSYEEQTGPAPEVSVTEGFDNIKISGNKIDATAPNYPEGWTIDVAQGSNSRHVYTTTGNYSSAGISLALADTGDKIITPATSAPMTAFSFWLKAQTVSGDTYITVSAYDGSVWTQMEKVAVAEYEGEILDLSSKLPAGAVQVKLEYTKSAGNCAIDDVSYTYGGSVRNINYFFEERNVTETSYDVTGLTPGVQYYYRVKAANETMTSNYSNEIKAGAGDDVQTLTIPVMLPATDVSDAGFTANWQPVSGADGYFFYTYLTHTAQTDENYTVAAENFDAVPASGQSENLAEYLDEYTKRPDWYVYMAHFENGKIGFDNSFAAFGIPGVLFSPTYTHSANTKITMEITAESAVGDELYVYNIYGENEEDYEEKTAAFTSGKQTFTFEFDLTVNGEYKENYFQIGSSTAGVTYIDDVKITAELKQNESVKMPYYYDEPLETSVSVSTADKQQGDAYSYTAMAYAYNSETEETIFSGYATPMPVSAASGIVQPDTKAAVYIDGDLHVVLDAPQTIQLYSVAGNLIGSFNGLAGENTISIPQQGIYIVKAGTNNFKIVK